MNKLFFSENKSILLNDVNKGFCYCPFKTCIKIYDHARIVKTFFETDFKFITSKINNNITEDIFDCNGIEISRFIEKIGEVYKTYLKIKNKSSFKIKVCQLTSCVISGLFNDIDHDNIDKYLVKYYQSGWCAEGNLQIATLNDLHLPIVNDRDSSTFHDFISETAYTTKTYLPVFYFEDNANANCSFILLEPRGRWEVRLNYNREAYNNERTLSVLTYSGNDSTSAFYFYLEQDEEYETFVTVFGQAKDQNECIKSINEYKRSKRTHLKAVFYNDYLNCLWAKPNSGNTIPLINKASELGIDYYVMDSGWYKAVNETDWFGVMGDWKENDNLFIGFGFKGISDYAISKNIKFGIWFELEVCTTNASASRNDESWFLHLDGERIYENGRYFFDLRNPEVREYLVSRIKYFYDLGIKYIKNDYNATYRGCDSDKGGSVFGLEEHAIAIKKLYEEIKSACPGIIIENCASGAMRSDEYILSSADLTSFSDCENYRTYPAIISGSLANVLPEQLGIWSVVYPSKVLDKYKSFPSIDKVKSWEDGEETVFNMVSTFMGQMYLSGRIDKADAKNIELTRQAISLHKEYADFISQSSPVLDSNKSNNFYKKEGIVTQELQLGSKSLLAVWHLEKGETSYVVKGKDVKLVYPLDDEMNKNIITQNGSNQITIKFDKDYQARLFEIRK